MFLFKPDPWFHPKDLAMDLLVICVSLVRDKSPD